MTASQRPHRPGTRAAVIVSSVLVGVSLVSLLLVGLYNYLSARDLIEDIAETRLVEIGTARIAGIEQGLSALEDGVSTLASDPYLGSALGELTSAFRGLDAELQQSEENELRSAYERAIADTTPEGIDPPSVESLLPESEAGRYLQFHYIARNPNPAPERRELVDAGDGSAYSRAHAALHPRLRALAEITGSRDMLLIEAESGVIVYTVDKKVEFATSLSTGPYRDTNLADAVLRDLRTAAAGEAVVVDFERYPPNGGRATLFIAAAVRDEGRLAGAVAVEVPIEALTDIVSAGDDSEGTGLGETGEIYIVGSDLLMRSESRLWIEDPAGYLEAAVDAGYDPEVTEAIEAWETTVLNQPVDSEPVATALDDEVFVGPATNYLGRPTVAVAGPLDLPGLDWVAVGEAEQAEVYAPLIRYRNRIALVAAILVPIVLLVGIVLTRRLLRPIEPIAQAAARIGVGDLDVALPGLSRDEFGDLERRLNETVDEVRAQRDELVRAGAETDELLLSVLPRRFLDHVKRGDTSIAESMRDATLIAISSEGDSGGTMDESTLVEIDVALSSQIGELAREAGIEHFHTSTTHRLFAAGLTTEGTEASSALAFVVGVRDLCDRLSEERHVHIPFRAGMAAGNVVAGVVGTERLAFDVWGPPLREALTLVAVAGDGEILVDERVSTEVEGRWPVRSAEGLVDLNGDEIRGWRVEEEPV